MSSFFSTPASQRKRKRPEVPASTSKRRNLDGPGRKQPARRTRDADESSISGSGASEDELSGHRAGSRAGSESDSDHEAQTAAERRLKLAERYLENVRTDVAEDEKQFEAGFNAEDVDRDVIAARLKEDVAEEKGRVHRQLTDQLDFSRTEKTVFRADTLSTTGVAICHPYAYTVSKDITLVKWKLVPPKWSQEYDSKSTKGNELPRRKKPKQVVFSRGNRKIQAQKNIKHHTAAILCVAASADGRFVATGGQDKRLIIWEAKTLEPLKVFTQHRDAVTSLAFRGKTNQLFSASKDRTVRIWSLNELAYVETLFGHQDEVVDVAAVGGSQERCVTVGARDRSARLWKIVDESQLVFRGGAVTKIVEPPMSLTGTNQEQKEQKRPLKTVEGSLDRVIQLDTQLFVTGSDSGALSLFALHKKKPLHILPLSHGLDPAPKPEDSSAEVDPANRKTSAQPFPRGVTALACVPFSDLFISGSWDGLVRIWKLSEDQKRIESAGVLSPGPAVESKIVGGELEALPIKGVINDLAVFQRGERGKDGVCVVAAVGTEPRTGRWLKTKGKNCAVVFEIPPLQAGVLANGTSS